jgi:hypothetical protein
MVGRTVVQPGSPVANSPGEHGLYGGVGERNIMIIAIGASNGQDSLRNVVEEQIVFVGITRSTYQGAMRLEPSM